MTKIQEVVSNLELMTRLLGCLTEEDLLTTEGRRLKKEFLRIKKRCVANIVTYKYVAGEDG